MATLDHQISNFLGAIGEEIMILEKRWSIRLDGKGQLEGLSRTVSWSRLDDVIKRSVIVYLRPKEHNIGYYETVVELLWPTGKKEIQTFSSGVPSEMIAAFIFSRFM